MAVADEWLALKAGCFNPGKERPLPSEKEAGWAQQRVLTFRK